MSTMEKSYHFNKSVVENYDKVISAYIGKDISVTAIVLKLTGMTRTRNWFMRELRNLRAPIIICLTRRHRKDLRQRVRSSRFLADRYSGKNHNSNYAKISNWILGNEINNQIWNYMGPADLNTYVSTYQQAFRTFYTAIKSTSANDRVYFHLISGGELRMRT